MSADLLLARIKLTIYEARWNDVRGRTFQLTFELGMLFSFQRPTKLPRRFGFSLSRSPPGEAADSTYFESTVKRKFREKLRGGQPEKSRVFTRRDPRPRPTPRIAEGGYCQDFFRTQEEILAAR